ncbi:hypothetical protein [Chloroflexus sp.]|uniref:hypothetical protein n=1 Tax=Chloroflexus sp. TaxID=1904827 RepID=UPI002ACD97AA|nr:hypothetical protein [Chloroflexus sp.]
MGRILSILIALAVLSSACGLGVTAPAALVPSSPTPSITVASTPTPIVVNIPIIM